MTTRDGRVETCHGGLVTLPSDIRGNEALELHRVVIHYWSKSVRIRVEILICVEKVLSFRSDHSSPIFVTVSILEQTIYAWGCEQVCQDTVFQLRDWANFA